MVVSEWQARTTWSNVSVCPLEVRSCTCPDGRDSSDSTGVERWTRSLDTSVKIEFTYTLLREPSMSSLRHFENNGPSSFDSEPGWFAGDLE